MLGLSYDRLNIFTGSMFFIAGDSAKPDNEYALCIFEL